MGNNNSGGPWARVVRTAFLFMLALVVLCGVWAAVTAPSTTTPTAEEQQRNEVVEQARQVASKNRQQSEQAKLDLCRAAAVCKKYDKERLECANAGSFKTCLRIKMGDDSVFTDSCNGYNEGGPALPPPPGAPNVIECFFLNTLR